MAATYDIVIVGAGVAGSAAAWFAARRGLRIALLDKAKFPRDKVCTCTVNPRSCSYLEEFGVLSDLQSHGLVKLPGFRTISYDGQTFEGYYHPSHPYLDYGHTIPRHILDEALLRKVTAAPTVDFFDDFAIAEIRSERDHAVVESNLNGVIRALRAPIVLDAAGRGSPVARKHGLFQPMREHRRFAIISQFRNVRWPTALFTVGTNEDVGPGYYCVFPITHEEAVVSLIVDETFWTAAKADPTSALDLFVGSDWQLRPWFAEASRSKDVVSFGPLAFSTTHVAVERVLMIGDSTGFYDPITGEGITFAFRSAELAVETAGEILTSGLPFATAVSSYVEKIRSEKQDSLHHSMRLQQMLKRPAVFNRFVSAMAANQAAANWLARAFGNLLDRDQRSMDHLFEVLTA